MPSDSIPYRETPQSRISDQARRLLRRDYPDNESRMRVVRWAEDEFYRVGLWPVGNLTRETSPENILFNLIEENVLLGDWMRARLIGEENVLSAEDFRDLIDRLTPGYWDESPHDSPDDETGDDTDLEVPAAGDGPRASGGDTTEVNPSKPDDSPPTSLEEAAQGLKRLFENPIVGDPKGKSVK